jgi:hypothetical protein
MAQCFAVSRTLARTICCFVANKPLLSDWRMAGPCRSNCVFGCVLSIMMGFHKLEMVTQVVFSADGASRSLAPNAGSTRYRYDAKCSWSVLIHDFHALIFSGMFAPFPSHARIWDRRGASFRALGHRYLAGRNQAICLVSIVQHELLLTWHGGWASVFCWPMAAGVCDGRTTTVQSTATNGDDTLCNPSQHEIKSQVIHRTWQHHSPHDHSPTSRLRCKAMHHPFWPFIPTHMCIFVPLLISVRCGALRFQLFIAGQRNGFANLPRNVAAINKRPRREQPPV